MRPMPELKVETARVEDLLPYAGNAKLHPHEQVDQIAKSIEEFGNNDPIAVWHNADGEMEIVEGHGRLMALKKLGIRECPVILLDHLDDEQRRAYALVHNKLTMNSDFDFEILADELVALDRFEMEEFGFMVGGDAAEAPEPAGENGFKYEETYAIEVVCESEADQERTYKVLTDQGYNCRVVVV